MACIDDDDIAVARFAAAMEGAGHQIMDVAELQKMPVEAKAGFANLANKYTTAHAEDIAAANPQHVDVLADKQLKEWFGDFQSWLTLPKDPGVLIGEDFIRPLTDALQQYVESGSSSWADFNANVVPVVKQLQERISDLGDPGRMTAATHYLDAWERGGSFFRRSKNGIFEKATYPARVMTGNLVSYNPFITAANVFEFLPKSLGVYGPQATIKGMTDFVAAGGLGKRIPELEAKGVYGKISNNFQKFDITRMTEEPLRGLGYYVSKAAGKDGLEGVEKIAFKYRPGREPLILLDHGGAVTVTLMRFAIESSKMYLQWYKNILDAAKAGDVAKAGAGAMSLIAFHYMTALQTGAASSVPAPLWGLLSDEQKEEVRALDDTLGLNLLQKTTGVSIEPTRLQPVGGVAFGLGFDLVNTAAEQGYKKAQQGVDALREGDPVQAAAKFTQAIITAGQAVVPGITTSVKKLSDVIINTITGETAPEDAPAEAGKKLLGLEV